jgi:hypothetical protein
MVQWRSLLVFLRLGGSFDDRQGGKLSGEGLSGPDNGRLCFIRLKRQDIGRQFLPAPLCTELRIGGAFLLLVVS